jgi:hypothetical protein
MPTLLWRVLSYVGYPDGMEPRYFWANERLGKVFWLLWKSLFIPEMMVLSGLATGRTTEEAAERAAFGILRDIMDHFLQELAAAIVGVFSRGNPSTDSWQ